MITSANYNQDILLNCLFSVPNIFVHVHMHMTYDSYQLNWAHPDSTLPTKTKESCCNPKHTRTLSVATVRLIQVVRSITSSACVQADTLNSQRTE